MAEITAFRNNALPYPVYGVPWTVVFPLLDADGDPVTGATCDSERSINGETGADCTNEGTEIPFTTTANKGMYYLTLTAAEMTGDIITVTVASATSKATTIVLYPRKLVTLATGNPQHDGNTAHILLAAGTCTYDNQFAGCLCVSSTGEARILQTSTASSQNCNVTPAWNAHPEAADTYTIYLPEGRQNPSVNVSTINAVATTSVTTINANQGTTQPVNFTGTGATAYVKGDTIQIEGTDATDQINTFANSACDTALADINLDHLLSAATAAVDMTAEVVDGSVISRIISSSDTSTFVPATHSLVVLKGLIDAMQADIGDASASTLGSLYGILGNAAATLTSRLPAALTGNGNIKSSVLEMITTALTAQMVTAWVKFFDKASPTGTVNSLPDAVPNAAGGLPTTSQVNAECDTALSDILLDHLMKLAVDTNWATTVTKNSVIDYLTSKDASQTFDRATDSQEAIRDKLPANLEDMSITDTTGLVAVPDTQKVDLNTIKTRAITDPGATVAIGTAVAQVGSKMDLVDAPSATAVASIKANLGTIPASGNWATVSTIFAELMEAGFSFKLIIQVLAAVVAGKCSGGGTGTITFRNLVDSLNRVVGTYDAGGRLTVTITPDP